MVKCCMAQTSKHSPRHMEVGPAHSSVAPDADPCPAVLLVFTEAALLFRQIEQTTK